MAEGWIPRPRPAFASRPELPSGRAEFRLQAPYSLAGDQAGAVEALTRGLRDGRLDQVLLGATGTGKTFTMANVIARMGAPALILAPNKTLAAQLYGEMKEFFPDNAVEYFVSYYDYYQPEAYVARTDTYIEKDSQINERIDRLRHAATRSLLERRDVVIVASVSCIYGIGSPDSYASMALRLEVGGKIDRKDLLSRLAALRYERNDLAPERGQFRASGDTIEIRPVHDDSVAWRISLFGDEIEDLSEFDPLTGTRTCRTKTTAIYPASHYVAGGATLTSAVRGIKAELEARLSEFRAEGKLLEAQRLEERTRLDLESLEAAGHCRSIENYSRHLTGRAVGDPPPTLLEYLPDDAILIVDESHVAVPQIGGMASGDRSRKDSLAAFGFRLPSCVDNRPLKFEEWDALRGRTIFVSATPGDWEIDRAGGVSAEQVIRPTGLLEPVCIVRPALNQVDDLLHEARAAKRAGERVLVTVLTKKMAEELAEHLHSNGVKTRWLHSDIETIERMEILRDLRLGAFDVLIGINLLREGLDIPECGLVAVLDADKEGFLRSKTALIQTIGRAARNEKGRAVLYADRVTRSMEQAISETDRRRAVQAAHNEREGIVPVGVAKKIGEVLGGAAPEEVAASNGGRESGGGIPDLLDEVDLRARMAAAAEALEFEEAARLRDLLKSLAEGTIPSKSSKSRAAGRGGRHGRR